MGPRVTSVVLLLVAAGLLMLGSSTRAWFEREIGGVTTSVGLREVVLCARDGCQTSVVDASTPPGNPRAELVLWSGRIGHGVGLATAFASIVCAMILATRRTRHGAIVVLGLSLVAAACGLVFVLGSDYERSFVGFSARTFLGGCALAFLGAVLALAKVPLVRWEPPARPR